MIPGQKFSRHACSGTLVSPRHVITAASCIGKIDATWWEKMMKRFLLIMKMIQNIHISSDSRGTLTSARLRPLNIDRFSIAFPSSSSTSPDLFLISNVFIGRSYTGFDCSPLTSAYGDIAVIELQENVVYSDSIHPACVMGWKRKQQSMNVTLFRKRDRSWRETFSFRLRSYWNEGGTQEVGQRGFPYLRGLPERHSLHWTSVCKRMRCENSLQVKSH